MTEATGKESSRFTSLNGCKTMYTEFSANLENYFNKAVFTNCPATS